MLGEFPCMCVYMHTHCPSEETHQDWLRVVLVALCTHGPCETEGSHSSELMSFLLYKYYCVPSPPKLLVAARGV